MDKIQQNKSRVKKDAHRPYRPSSLQTLGKYTDIKDKPNIKTKSKKKEIFALKILNGLLRKENRELRDKIVEMALELNYLKRMEGRRKR